MCAADRLHACLGEPEVPTLPASTSSFTAPATSSIGTLGSTRCWYSRSIVSVLSRLSEASTPRLIVSGRLSRPPRFGSVCKVEPELRGDDDTLANRLERLADELLVGEPPVHLGGVEEGNAAVDGDEDQGDHLLPLGDRR